MAWRFSELRVRIVHLLIKERKGEVQIAGTLVIVSTKNTRPKFGMLNRIVELTATYPEVAAKIRIRWRTSALDPSQIFQF